MNVRHSWFVTVIMLFAGAALASGQEAWPSADEALKRLKDGNSRFVADQLSHKDLGTNRRNELAKGQRPLAVILTCADSRVAPEIVFDQGLGDLFVLRVAGNISERYVIGSIEYAVEHFRTPLIVVMGHEGCGAVDAALNGVDLDGDLSMLVKKVYTGKDLPGDKAEALSAAIRNNARHQAELLTRQSKVIQDVVDGQRVRIVSGVYSLKTGEIIWLDISKNGSR
jgi:carbonic anhydrase